MGTSELTSPFFFGKRLAYSATPRHARLPRFRGPGRSHGRWEGCPCAAM